MVFIYNVIVVLHFVGLAALLGGFLVQLSSPTKGINKTMVHGALTQLVTGLALAGILSAGLLNDEPVDHTKIGIKLGVTLAVVIVVLIGRKSTTDAKSMWATVGGLTMLNIVVAVFV
jgi:ABC-type Fe3+-siderophore transport system permease subunit